MKTSYYVPPKLVSRLQKGDSIPRSEIERLIPTYESEDQFKLRLMSWVALLRRALMSAGRPMTLRILEHGQRVQCLTDPEASDYNHRYHHSYLHRARNRHQDMLAVEVANLTPDQRKTHDRSLCNQGLIQSSIESARRAIRAQIHHRQTPPLMKLDC